MFSWFRFLTYAVVTAVTPGPNTLLSMSNGSRNGFWTGLPFNLGIWTGLSVVLGLCTLFCDRLSGWIPQIQLPMRIVGAAYMLYLAWQILRSGNELQQLPARDGFVSGLLLQFVNPKIYLYGIVSMQAYVLPFYQGRILPLLGFALLLAAIGFFFTLCWSAFGASFRKVLSRHGRAVNTIMALLLVYCAISLFLP